MSVTDTTATTHNVMTYNTTPTMLINEINDIINMLSHRSFLCDYHTVGLIETNGRNEITRILVNAPTAEEYGSATFPLEVLRLGDGYVARYVSEDFNGELVQL